MGYTGQHDELGNGLPIGDAGDYEDYDGRTESDMAEQLNNNKELTLMPNLPFICSWWRKSSAPLLKPQRA